MLQIQLCYRGGEIVNHIANGPEFQEGIDNTFLIITFTRIYKYFVMFSPTNVLNPDTSFSFPISRVDE